MKLFCTKREMAQISNWLIRSQSVAQIVGLKGKNVFAHFN